METSSEKSLNILFSPQNIVRSVLLDSFILVFLAILPLFSIYGGIPDGSTGQQTAQILLFSLLAGLVAGIFFGSFLFPIEQAGNIIWFVLYFLALTIIIFLVEVLFAFIVATANGIALFTPLLSIDGCIQTASGNSN